MQGSTGNAVRGKGDEKMEEKETWLFCPKCHKKTRIKVYDNTTMVHFPLFCHWCKTESIIVYVAGIISVEKEMNKTESAK